MIEGAITIESFAGSYLRHQLLPVRPPSLLVIAPRHLEYHHKRHQAS
jgi:hypothetical protein